MVETKDASGDWIYIYDVKDETRKFVCCISYGLLRTREEAIKRADEVMTFCLENKGSERIIKELEYKEV